MLTRVVCVCVSRERSGLGKEGEIGGGRTTMKEEELEERERERLGYTFALEKKNR